jgi:hypothetical protein
MTTYNEAFYLSDYEIRNARPLTWEIETNPEYSWDRTAFFYDSDASILQSTFSVNLIAGNDYSFSSSSFFDPFILTIADNSGVALELGPADSGVDGRTSVNDFSAPYTGKYYIDAAWNTGSYYDWGSVSVYEYGEESSPIATNDTYRINAGTSSRLDVLSNDIEGGGSTLLTDSIPSGPSNGTTQITTDNQILYTPETGFDGTDEFTYTVSDGNGGTASAAVEVTVNPQAPDPDPTQIAARIFLNPDASFTLADPAVVFGRSGGQETLKLMEAARGVQLDGNIERVELAQDLSATTFQVVDGSLQISAVEESIMTFIGGLNQAITLQLGNSVGTLTQTDATTFALKGPSGQATIGTTPITPDIGLGGATSVDEQDNGEVLSAASGDVTFDFASGDYGVTVENFGAGDVLDFDDIEAAIANIPADTDPTDGRKQIAVSNPEDGSTVTVTLAGLTDAQDSGIFNQSSFISMFGSESLIT